MPNLGGDRTSDGKGESLVCPRLAYLCGVQRELLHTRLAFGASRGENIRRAQTSKVLRSLERQLLGSAVRA
jgi:hypothetical protein